MFTGIIEEGGVLKEIVSLGLSQRLTIGCSQIVSDLELGASVAVNGICLTVTSFNKEGFCVDVMPETLKNTNLNCLEQGEQVNLERALQLGGRLGGHFVSGHVDGLGVLRGVLAEGNSKRLQIAAPSFIMKYIIEKGSVALDGVSLTVLDLKRDSFDVALIPMTAGKTTLGKKEIGSKINIECDILVKYLAEFLNRSEKKEIFAESYLKENGFM